MFSLAWPNSPIGKYQFFKILSMPVMFASRKERGREREAQKEIERGEMKRREDFRREGGRESEKKSVGDRRFIKRIIL